MADAIRQARVDLAAAFRWAVRFGLHEGICNHFSYAPPEADGQFLLNPQGLHWSEITASTIIAVDFQGNLIDGELPPEPTAFHIHGRMHQKVPQARCIMHTHMPYATAIACAVG